MSGHIKPIASRGVSYWACVGDRCNDHKLHTTEMVLSHRVGSLAGAADLLSISGGNTMCHVSGKSWHAYGAANCLPTTLLGESSLRLM